MAQPCRDKTCDVCGIVFSPTGRKQKRCVACKDKQPGVVPKCGCGCGQDVTWNRSKKGYLEFVWGHHLRKKHFDNPGFKKGFVPPHKGKITYHEFTCRGCGAAAKHVDKNRKFCAEECYHMWNRGENHVHWSGGRATTQYKWICFPDGTKRREHHLVIEKSIERYLNSTEVVHHIDEDRGNNALENLYLFHCDNCHVYHHVTGRQLQYEYQEVHAYGKKPKEYGGRPTGEYTQQSRS